MEVPFPWMVPLQLTSPKQQVVREQIQLPLEHFHHLAIIQ